MTQPTPIKPAVEFNAAWTKDFVRPAFEALARDQDFLECTTLRDQVLYANDFLFGEAFTTLPLALTDIANFLGMYSDATVGQIIR